MIDQECVRVYNIISISRWVIRMCVVVNTWIQVKV